MNIPGFTAEASAYKSSACYVMGGIPTDVVTNLLEPQATNVCAQSGGAVQCTAVHGVAEGVLWGGLIGGAIGGAGGAGLGALIGAAYCWLVGCD